MVAVVVVGVVVVVVVVAAASNSSSSFEKKNRGTSTTNDSGLALSIYAVSHLTHIDKLLVSGRGSGLPVCRLAASGC